MKVNLNCKDVVFVYSATAGMNMILNSLHVGDHVITTNAEHHCVYRPLHHLKNVRAIEYDIAEYVTSDLCTDEEAIFSKITPKTKMVIMNHASNVTGTVFDVASVGRKLKGTGIRFIVDCSQTAGVLDISLDKLSADAVLFSAHKHMYGLPGIGIIGLRDANWLSPLIMGGTGTKSQLMYQPMDLPERLEVGTVDVPAYLALYAGIIRNQEKREGSLLHERELIAYFLKEIQKVKDVHVHRVEGLDQLATFSLSMDGYDPTNVLAPYLYKHGIITRPGLQCAPMIHKVLGTYPEGTLRVSFSEFTQFQDIDCLVSRLCELTT